MKQSKLIETANNQAHCHNYEKGWTLLGNLAGEEIYSCPKGPFGCMTCGSYSHSGEDIREALQTQQSFHAMGHKTDLGDHLAHDPI